jgi:hypothetical protein
MAGYEIDNRKWNEAIKKIKTAIGIIEKLYGQNSIQLVKYLTNMSMVYYEKCQLS